MTRPCWGRIIRGPWLKTILAAVAVAATAADEPLAALKSASSAIDAGKYSAAIATLQPLARKLPLLEDYVAWFLATAQFAAENYAEVPKSLDPVWKQTPPSPLVARAAMLAAKAYEQNDQAQAAVEILRKNYAALPQPTGDLAMASAFEAANDRVSAAVYFQRAYYGYPLSIEAERAGAELARLRAALGDDYPPAMPEAMLGRALKLLDSGNWARAKRELESIVPKLGGAGRDLARVRIGVADYRANETLRAQRYLRELELSSPEADAERICYLAMCARRLKNHEEVQAALDKLARIYPQSKWRLEAIVSDANSHLLENDLDAYEPLYRSCYESFPSDPMAAYCHWKIAWGHYLRRRLDAAELLRAHLRLFPASENSPAALYFLGRLAESENDPGVARAYYDEIVREYPNYYYAVEARERLKTVTATPAVATREFLSSVAFPPRARKLNFEPNGTTRLRIARARMLASADLEDWAEGELRFAGQTEDQPHVIGLELAKLAAAKAGPDQAMRYIKHYAGGYLYMPLDSAPEIFWKFAFPMPFRQDVERFAKQNSLDPFLVAALIRQESEFNPKAVSRKNARGLMQIEPLTGRELSRKLQIRPYSTARLFQPAMNVQLGSYYFKTIVAALNGHLEAALAAYNAGPSRARSWLSWGEFREPAEFVETVPFSETRNYIETVLRNADVYRRLYGEQVARLRPRDK
jgi:soluble lytic murein transglycosylase